MSRPRPSPASNRSICRRTEPEPCHENRDGVEVTPIGGRRNRETAEVWLARKPTRKPRWRTIRGCWGEYAYPFEAFAPGAALEVHLFEEGKDDEPRIVPITAGMAARIEADFAASPEAAGADRREP